MISEMEQARHAEERGAVLQALKLDYLSKMTSVKALARALFMAGRSLTVEGLHFHLNLLADSGYIKIWRAEEIPGFRADRDSDVRRDSIVFARLTPKGLGLIDGQVAADSAVSF